VRIPPNTRCCDRFHFSWLSLIRACEVLEFIWSEIEATMESQPRIAITSWSKNSKPCRNNALWRIPRWRSRTKRTDWCSPTRLRYLEVPPGEGPEARKSKCCVFPASWAWNLPSFLTRGSTWLQKLPCILPCSGYIISSSPGTDPPARRPIRVLLHALFFASFFFIHENVLFLR